MWHSFLVLCGIVGNVAFGYGSVQVAWTALRDGKSPVDKATTWTYSIACDTFGAFLIGTYGFNWLFAVLIVEAVAWGIVMWYAYRPRAELTADEQARGKYPAGWP